MVEKSLTIAEAFPRTLNKLEGLINYLEKSTGTAHKGSPFEKPAKPGNESKASKDGANKEEKSSKDTKKPPQQQELKEKPAPKKVDETDKKEKSEKQEKKKPGPLKEEIEDYFAQIEIRVGKIVEVWKVVKKILETLLKYLLNP